MRRLPMMLLLLWFLSSLAHGQSPAVAELEQYIAAAREAWEVPGLAVGIVKDDKVQSVRGYGLREQGGPDPVDADTLFAIASNTKAFTATALAMLVERGKLRWSDRVQDHLPYFRLYDPYVSAEMRVEDLLCHRSGLGTFSGDLLWYGTGYSPGEVLRRARHLPAAGAFRAEYGYSNLMFLAAGEIVAHVSGQSWPEFVHQQILQPLEMTRTITSVTQLEQQGNFATPHKPTPEGLRRLPWPNWDTMAAAGGLISSAADMTKWLRVQLNHGKIRDDQRLFKAASARTMWAPRTIIPLSKSSRERYPSTHFRAYGLGWSLSDYKGRKIVAHGGAYDGMYSRVVLVPEERLGVVVLTNSMTAIPTALANRVVDAYLGGPQRDWSASELKRDRNRRKKFYERIARHITPRAEDTRPSRPLEAYAGRYRSPLYGDVTVRKEETGLVVRLQPNPDLVADLTHLHYDTFVLRWRSEFAWFAEGTAQFLLNAKGEAVELQLRVPNEDLWFHELKLIRGG